jgi:undecaprenyl-diphosphatase
LHDFITARLFNLPVIAVTLFLGGVLILVLEKFYFPKNLQKNPVTEKITALSWRQALAIGCAQTLALVPGVSRALVTIYGGIFVGTDRKTAAEFSFLLALPILGGATVYELFLKKGVHLAADANFWLAFFSSFLLALLALKYFFAFVKKHDFKIFGWYRLALSAAIALVLWL